MNAALFALLAASAGCAAAGQILLKLGANGRDTLAGFANPTLAGGLALYGLGAALWIAALSKLPLHVVYPFTLVTLALVGALAVLVLGERPNATALAGWAIVGLGVCVVWYGANA